MIFRKANIINLRLITQKSIFDVIIYKNTNKYQNETVLYGLKLQRKFYKKIRHAQNITCINTYFYTKRGKKIATVSMNRQLVLTQEHKQKEYQT